MKMDQNGIVFFYRELDDQADLGGLLFMNPTSTHWLLTWEGLMMSLMVSGVWSHAPGSRWRLGELYKRLAFASDSAQIK